MPRFLMTEYLHIPILRDLFFLDDLVIFFMHEHNLFAIKRSPRLFLNFADLGKFSP